MASKQPITKEMVKVRVSNILNALVDKNDLEFNLLMLQLSNWTVSKRRQVFRSILDILINKTNSFEWTYMDRITRAQGIRYYQLNTVAIKTKLIDTFINKVRDMDRNERFSPEKVITLNKLNAKGLMMNPETFNYLLSSGIIILSDKFTFTQSQTVYPRGQMYNFRTFFRAQEKLTEIYKNYEINSDVFYSPEKLHCFTIINILNNMDLLLNKIIKDPKNLTQSEKINTAEVLSAMQKILNDLDVDLHKIAYTSKDEWEKINEQLRDSIKCKQLTDVEFKEARGIIREHIFEKYADYSKLLIDNRDIPKKIVAGSGIDPYTFMI